MENMRKCAELLCKIRNTSSTNAKQELLEYGMKQQYSETLKKVLNYTFDPFKMFGLTDATLDKTKPDSMSYVKANEHNVFDLLDTLSKSNINDVLRGQAKALLMNIEDEQVRNMVQGIMVKDLKLGVNVTTVNKVCKDLIPKFDVQLAESFAKQKPGFLKNKEVWITTKLDGNRIVFDPYKKTFYTRQGKEYTGIDFMIDDCYKLSSIISETAGLDELVMLDGELVHRPVEGMNSQELYALTTSIARKKGYHKDKEKLQFNMFDFIPVSEFQSGKTAMKYKARRNHMDEVFNSSEFETIVPVHALYSGKFDEEVLMTLLRQVEADGGEGLMINTDSVYETKRTKSLLKVKSFFDADVYVVDIEEGAGRNKGKMGAAKVMFKYGGEELYTHVGSGWSDEQRKYYWENKDELIGKVIECQYFETSKDAKTGVINLRFPTFNGRVRDDKGLKDITDVKNV